eukprot:s516_g1.t1
MASFGATLGVSCGGNGDAESALQTYDNQRYERQMFYFNTHRRIAKYKHEYLEYFRCACFDCSSEAQILEHYVRVDVPDLSRWLHKECHRYQENPRTLFHGNPDPVTYDRLAKGLDLNKESAGTFCSSWMRSTKRRSAAGRRQLQHILRSGRAVLRPVEIRETLTSIPPMVLPGDIEVEEELGDEDAEFVSITDSVREDLEGSGYVQRRAEFHKGTGEHSWGLTDPWNYKLRSLSYFEDGSKIPSGPAMLELIDVDVSRIGALGPIFESAKHSDFSYQALRRQGDTRFLWIWNLVLPPYQAVLTAALDPTAAWLQNEKCPQALVWRRFLAANSEERKAKLKVIFSVEVGPWVLKKVAIKKPTLIGTKLSMASYYVPEDYIEITLDVTNGGKGGGYEEMVTGMVLRHVKSLVCSVCCLLEATEQDELPECALFAAHFSHVDFGKMRMMTAI